ncbi:hypothetical protein EDD16DRAFT_1046221 [Pisolithus croceorrhizus]|nr:hypothetical protein EDD16DRAFT_1046221 [Pisolithus croceorrhizus]KAI6142547.1 hypothetical protein EDD17DRAFT_220702 [Pisolithus thermaeus]
MIAVRLLCWLAFVHTTGIYLFTRGFLLSRLALPNKSREEQEQWSRFATHKRAVLLVIDALRFDFVSDHPPDPPSPNHHNILTLPRELTAAYPQHSFIFNAYADPPTTTLQRIKGLTTGSLPTFVDVGESFSGSVIQEDSLLHQLGSSGHKVAFVGDNTWLSLFPTFLDHNLSYPFDSFDVEDLHTVDSGVISHLPSIMQQNSEPWTLAIGHGLGVDHAGHRVGPDHPVMKAKLEQMNTFLGQLVRIIDEDTLLILLGDHGMDQTGNHGGDSIFETSSAVWIYSRGAPLSSSSISLPAEILPKTTFPGERLPHRSIQQIDLVPTISLLLGLPIPFNNLGSIVPELFDRGDSNVNEALELNARQIKRYLDAYRASASGGELDGVWSDLVNAWSKVSDAPSDTRVSALFAFSRLSLSTCRSLWAQFSLTLIGGGLLVMFTGIVASYALFSLLGNSGGDQKKKLEKSFLRAFKVGALGSVVSGFAYPLVRDYLDGVHAHHFVLFGGAVASSLTLTLTCKPRFTFDTLKSTPVLLILHTLCFASNSFTIWEDHIVLFLCLTSLAPSVLIGFTAPTPRLRNRILGFSALFAVCVRLMMLSTVCREEQHPNCTVTFYASLTSSAPPVLALVLAPVMAVSIPHIVRRILAISKSDNGIARVFLPWTMTAAMLAGTTFWIFEWIHSMEWFGDVGNMWLRNGRTMVARVTVMLVIFAGLAFWSAIPVCLDIQRTERSTRTRMSSVTGTNGESPVVADVRLKSSHFKSPDLDTQVTVTLLGFANAFGSPYLILWSIFLSVVWLCMQLTGQVVLGLFTVALLAYLEIVDSVRDVWGLYQAYSKGFASTTHPSNLNLDGLPLKREVQFSEIVPLALLATHAFYGTGHQPTIPALQWKTAFVLVSSVRFPYSQITVILNTLGPYFLAGLAAPLLALWNFPPFLPSSPSLPVSHQEDVVLSVLRSCLGLTTYFNSLLLGSAVFAAGLRRHLMVWKVFAPRYMFSALEMGALDMGVLVGVWGVWRVRRSIGRLLRGADQLCHGGQDVYNIDTKALQECI